MNDKIQNQGLDLEKINLEIAIQGAKDLVEVTKQIISDEENKERYRKVEIEAYKKLTAVDVAQANALIDAERVSDGELKNPIQIDEAKLAAAIIDLYKDTYMDINLTASSDVANANLLREQMAKDGAEQLIEAKKMALMASFSDNYQDRNEENKEANHLEEDAYRKLAAVDVAQANALVEAEREKIEELLKRSIRLDEAKLLAAMRDLNPELYKAIESRKAEQQRMAAEGAKQLFEAQNMSEHLRNEANKERLEKNSNPILRGAMAMEGAKLLVLAAETELKASFSEDARERDFEKRNVSVF
ncbi:hypothetical protein [Xylella fastidiosa]|uniref:Uncharacterized protein n=1 Tax=Xylella fastidiosa subsp. fastidiosa TaxID=644356 RepID=A0AAJ5UJ66_XYLFS|nr:hypothetical protein [Xylella fastidiosa]WCF29573.1 hypothetical protein OK117_12300 [Xylella fastidiosa subsp. fastidiosa]